MPKTREYRVVYERAASGQWTASIDRTQGVSCITQARTLAGARKRIREALALFLNAAAAERALLHDDFVLPADTRKLVIKATAARAAAKAANEVAAKASVSAAKALRSTGVSLQDAADILELSKQRVHQLTA